MKKKVLWQVWKDCKANRSIIEVIYAVVNQNNVNNSHRKYIA